MSEQHRDAIRHFMDHLMKEHQVPGASVAVVYRGQTIISQGFGVKDLASNKPVNDQTKFCIGSITKGFTAALLAGVLPQYGLNWNTPVNKIFEGIEFPDAILTEKTCIRDILAHKMGIELGESDFGWICAAFKRQQILQRLKHLPLSPCGFRVSLTYNNFMYAVAGMVAERLTGLKWEELVRDRFFQLLGMEDSNFIDEEASDLVDIAKPHLSVDGNLTEISLDIHRGADAIGPAGSITSSARDMTKWIQFLLDEGKLSDLPIIPAAQLRECWKPQFALPCGKPEWDGYVQKPQFPVTETRDTYGFGWYRGTYRGYQMLAHGGELCGYDALITLYPDLKLGIYTAFNGPGGEHAVIGNQLAHYFITDCVLGEDMWLSADNVGTFPQPWAPREKIFIPKINTDIVRGINSTRPLTDYVGTFRHGFLGDISVNIDSATAVLNMYHGKVGNFKLHPNGEIDEFRLEGTGAMAFLHRADIFAPSDWMMIRFCSVNSDRIDSCVMSLFESGPMFKKVDVIM